MTSLQAAYRRAYDAYKASGLCKIKFYRTRLKEFLPKGCCMPAKSSFYQHFHDIERAIKDSAQVQTATARLFKPDSALESLSEKVTPPPAVKPRVIGPNIQFAEVSEDELSHALTESALSPDRSSETKAGFTRLRRASCTTLFRMELANGVLLEFETGAPELLAMQLMQAASGGVQ